MVSEHVHGDVFGSQVLGLPRTDTRVRRALAEGLGSTGAGTGDTVEVVHRRAGPPRTQWGTRAVAVAADVEQAPLRGWDAAL